MPLAPLSASGGGREPQLRSVHPLLTCRMPRRSLKHPCDPTQQLAETIQRSRADEVPTQHAAHSEGVRTIVVRKTAQNNARLSAVPKQIYEGLVLT